MTIEQASAAFAFNTPLVEPRRLETKGIHTVGLRISEPCIAKRIIQAADPYTAEDRYFPFDVGVGQRGDDMAHLWVERRVLPVARALEEVVVPWKFDHAAGEAHLDAYVTGTAPDAGFDYDGVWEVKTTTDDLNCGPNDPRRWQLARYLRLLELNGGEAYAVDAGWIGEDATRVPVTIDPEREAFRLVFLHPGNYRVHGPWTVTLDDDDRARLDDEFALMDSLWARRDAMDLWNDEELKAACSCYSCFPTGAGEAKGETAKLLNELASWIVNGQAVKANIDTLREKLCVTMRPGVKVYTDLATASMSGDLEKPKLTVRVKPAAREGDDS